MPTIRLFLSITGRRRTCFDVQRLTHVVSVAAPGDAFCHDASGRNPGDVFAVADRPQRDIPVGDHPGIAPISCSRIIRASVVTGVSGDTQWAPLCIEFFTFMTTSLSKPST